MSLNHYKVNRITGTNLSCKFTVSITFWRPHLLNEIFDLLNPPPFSIDIIYDMVLILQELNYQKFISTCNFHSCTLSLNANKIQRPAPAFEWNEYSGLEVRITIFVSNILYRWDTMYMHKMHIIEPKRRYSINFTTFGDLTGTNT